MTIRNKIFLLSLGGVASVALSGCLGSTTSAVATLAPISGTKTAAAPAAVTTANKTYNALGSSSKTGSVLVGSGVVVGKNANSGGPVVGDLGTLNGSSRIVSLITQNISPTKTTVIAISGKADASGKVTSANGDTLIPDTSIDQTGYNYVGIADSKTTAGGDTFEGVHVLGVFTASADMPTAGNATYKGPAVVEGLKGSGSTATRWTLSKANATVSVNFASNTVGSTIVGTAGTGVPLDKITTTGATISGSSFSGGKMTTSLGGVNNSLKYANSTLTNTGMFYGYDKTNSRPAEVGGIVVNSGSKGSVAAVYIAK